MKNLGNVKEAKDITNKEYVDQRDAELDALKLEESDFEELSNIVVQQLWNQYMEG